MCGAGGEGSLLENCGRMRELGGRTCGSGASKVGWGMLIERWESVARRFRAAVALCRGGCGAGWVGQVFSRRACEGGALLALGAVKDCRGTECQKCDTKACAYSRGGGLSGKV